MSSLQFMTGDLFLWYGGGDERGEEGFSGDGEDSKSLWTGMIFFFTDSSVASL